MFGFGKNKKSKATNKTNEQEQTDLQLTEQIHTMPERFYIKPARKRSGLTWIILLGVLIIAALVAAAIYFSISLKNQANVPTPVEQATANQPVPVGNPNPVENNTATTTEPNIENQNPEASTSTQEVVDGSSDIEAQELAADQNSDGLTLLEEQLYKTNPEVKDTDLDTYEDGTEIIKGYDPTVVGKTLEQTGFFRKYSNTFYMAFYPNGWELRDESPGSSEVLFISNSNEFVEILILQNLNKLSLDDWYKQQFPEVAQSTINRISINGIPGILHPNGLTYYLMNPSNSNSIYVITYNLAGEPDPHYLYTFRSVANSFRLIE